MASPGVRRTAGSAASPLRGRRARVPGIRRQLCRLAAQRWPYRLCSGDAGMCHGGLVPAEGVAFGEESHHLLAGGTSVQLVGHIGQTCRHAAQQRFDVQRVFLDHRARAVRVGQDTRVMSLQQPAASAAAMLRSGLATSSLISAVDTTCGMWRLSPRPCHAFRRLRR